MSEVIFWLTYSLWSAIITTPFLVLQRLLFPPTASEKADPLEGENKLLREKVATLSKTTEILFATIMTRGGQKDE